MSLTGANLAVDVDRARLLEVGQTSGQDLRVTLPLYSAGIACLALAGVMARRRAADPLVRARVETLKSAERAIHQASALSDGGGSAALGRALRELVAALPSDANQDLDELIAECDALRFSPDSERTALPSALADRARSLIAKRLKSGGGSVESA
jgi:hypothetical protein